MAESSEPAGNSQAANADLSGFTTGWQSEINPKCHETILLCRTPDSKKVAGMNIQEELIKFGRDTKVLSRTRS